MPPRKSKVAGPRPRRTTRPSTAAPTVTGGIGSSSSSITRISEPAVPLSTSGSSLENSSATIAQLQAPMVPSSHRGINSNCNAAAYALEESDGREVGKSLADETASSIGSTPAAPAEENGQKSDCFVGAEAHTDDSLRDVAMETSVDRGGSVNTNQMPKTRVVKRIVKVVRVVKRKVPKKVQKGDGEIECSNQEVEAKGITNRSGMEKEGEQAGSIAGVPMEVDYLKKAEVYGIECDGGFNRSDQDDDELSKDTADKPGMLLPRSNVLEKPQLLDPLVEKNGECVVSVCSGGEEVKELKEGSEDMAEIEEPCTEVLENHDNGGVNFSSGGDKVKDLDDSMDRSGVLESCTEVVEKPVTLDSLAENNDDCADTIGSSDGETVNEDSKKCVDLKDKFEGDDEGLIQGGEMETVERLKRRKTEIFVGGLDKDAKEEDIKKVFAEVGDVVGVRLLRHNTFTNGKNKGYAFVRYGSAADAKKALEKFPNVEIRGKQCRTAPVEGNDTIYLGNINKTWLTEDVVKLLQEVGIVRVDKVTLLSDPNNSQRNRGYAFLELETPKDAKVAFSKFQKWDVVGKLQGIKVAWAEPLDEPDEEEMLKVKCVYAEFIPSSWDELRVRDHFKKIGEIENITLARNLRSSKRKDFAFINFKNREDALSCVQSYKSGSLCEDGSKVNICVSLARPLARSSVKKKVSTPKESLKAAVTSSGAKPKERQRNVKYPQKQAVNRNVGIMPSRTAEAVQFLREQDALWHPQPQLSSGYGPNPYGVQGIKRPYSALEENYLYSYPRGYSHPRVESSPAITSQRYNTFSQQDVGMVDPYYEQQQHQTVAPSISQGYGYRNYLERPQRSGEPSFYGTGNRHFRS